MATYTLNGKVVQKADDGSPGLFYRQTTPIIPIQYNQPLPSTCTFPGVYGRNDGNNVYATPLDAKIFADQKKGTTQANGVFQKDGLSVVNYLRYRGLQTLSTTNTNGMNVWNQGWEITTPKADGKNYVKIYMPNGAMSSLSTLQISTELADTVVYQPAVSNIEITGLSWQVSGQIGDRDILKIDLTQRGTILSDAVLTTTFTGGQEVFVNPQNQKVALGAGQSTSVYVEVLNTGASEQKTGALTVTLTNDLGQVTSQKSIDYTLLPKGTGNTQLTVLVKDKNTSLLVSGIQVAVAWGTNSGTYESKGGTFTVNLEGYQGQVSVTSVETTTYKSATASATVSKGTNTLILEIEPQGYTPGIDWLLIALIIGIIVVVCVIGVIVYYATQKGKHRRRRR